MPLPFLPSSPAHRRVALAAAASLAVLIVAGYAVSHVPPPSPRAATAEAQGRANWAGKLETATAEPVAAGAPVTSASYVMHPAPALKELAHERPCNEPGCATMKISRVALPPRRPQTVVAYNLAASPPPAPQAGFFHAIHVADQLPSTGTLLKPFRVVGDTFSNLIKKF